MKRKTASLSFCTRFPVNCPGGNPLPSVIHAFKHVHVYTCVFYPLYKGIAPSCAVLYLAVLHPDFFFYLIICLKNLDISGHVEMSQSINNN